MPGPKPGALPAWRPPSAFEFKGSRADLLHINIVKIAAGETPLGRSAGETSNPIYSDRTVALPHCTDLAPNLPGLFDFSSLRAGTAMLLMRFFAVNPPPARACTDTANLWISGYFVVGFAVEG